MQEQGCEQDKKRRNKGTVGRKCPFFGNIHGHVHNISKISKGMPGQPPCNFHKKFLCYLEQNAMQFAHFCSSEKAI